ncbi:MAG: alpha/beta hydrolase-fold protein [Acidobacteriota bacterium]
MHRIRRLAVAAAVLAVAWAGGRAIEARRAPQKTDILKLTPKDLEGPDANALFQKAADLYQERKYEEAARAYVELLRLRPGQNVLLYNLACCYALMGADRQAADFLKAAWAAGFHDLQQIERDTDFDRVRSSRPFLSAMKELKKDSARLDARTGRLIELPARTLETVRVLEPEGYDPSRRYPLVIGLHGAGADDASFSDFFAEAFRKSGFLFCAPRAQYARAVGFDGSVGFFWFEMKPGPGRVPEPLSRKLSEEYVLDVLQAVQKVYPVDPANVFLLGFSQGGFLAYSLGLRHPRVFRGVIPIGGWLDPRDFSTAEAEAARATSFLVCHSPEDMAIPLALSNTSVAYLKEKGIPVESFPYAGGHVVSPAVVEKVTHWIAGRLAPAHPVAQTR